MKVNINKIVFAAAFVLLLQACTVKGLQQKTPDTSLPNSYDGMLADTSNTASLPWKEFFAKDPDLEMLIDSALVNNQELNILLQEIKVAQSEVKAKTGEYLPFVNARVGAGMDKVGEYTRNGAVEENLDIKEDTPFPKILGDFQGGLFASWELDVWKKLRNSKNAAVARYLSSVEGKNFMITNIVSEISRAYYELLTLDNQLQLVNQNISILENGLQIVRLQKLAGKTNELAVKRFEAELYKNQSHIYELKQKIIEAENEINFLVGRKPQHVLRDANNFNNLGIDSLYLGVPSQLLQNRPDIRQSEMNLEAANLDVKVARANFYPSFTLSGGVGFQAFNPKFLFSSPQSILMNLAGDMVAPLINRNAIKAQYMGANAKQIQAAYDYERTI